jgi:hypothetical protein
MHCWAGHLIASYDPRIGENAIFETVVGREGWYAQISIWYYHDNKKLKKQSNIKIV